MIHNAPSKDQSIRKLLSSSIYGDPEAVEKTPSQSLGESANDSWMVAYLDLMTLLLALFVIMGALSHAKSGVNLEGKTADIQQRETPGKPETMDASVARQGHKQNVEASLNRIIGSNSLGGMMAAKVHPGQIRLQMDASLLFDAGQSRIKDDAKPVLIKMSDVFKNSARTVDVEGHSDTTPIDGSQINNWSLSAARAVSVVEKLIEMGVPPEKLHATAYGDTRPIASNATEEGRAKNRRVEFVVELGPEFVRQRQVQPQQGPEH